MSRQTVITEYYMPVSNRLSLFARFDMFISKTLKRVITDKPIMKLDTNLKQSLMTDYFSTIVKPPRKQYITDYFNPIHALQDYPNGI